MDKLIRAKTLSATTNPNQIIYAAMHQDYSSSFVADEELPDEETCADIIIKRLLKVSHWGPLEHGQVAIGFGFFPHSVMQQVRTHRGEKAGDISFDCSSFRYTGDPIAELGREMGDPSVEKGLYFGRIEELFYVRPEGEYINRRGQQFTQTLETRVEQLRFIADGVINYARNVDAGMPYEMARGFLPFDYRQHFVMSANTRTVFHLLDMRHKRDAQIECQWWAALLFEEFIKWNPYLAAWYEENRLGKGRLAP